MRYFLRILIIAIFFVLVFIPRSTIGVVNYWLLFLLLVVVAFLYLIKEYYVSKKAVNKILNDDFEYSIACEKIPFDETQDFIRGRLVVYKSMILLYKKEKGKISLGWSKSIDELDSIEFGKTSTKRKGFTLFDKDEKYEFVNYIFKINQDEFIKALNFEI
ncbi:MAG: hypothetical protein ACPKM0_08085 [Pleomorphochaeta sp.]